MVDIPFTLVAIGKCGSTTVRNTLRQNGITPDVVHVRKPRYSKNQRYVVLLRNPVERFVSAYNWRQHLRNTIPHRHRNYPRECRLLSRYSSVEQFVRDVVAKRIDVESIRSPDRVGHLFTNIRFYLRGLLRKCTTDQIIGVVCCETMAADMQRLFDIDVTVHEKKHQQPFELRPQLRAKLKLHLREEYAMIDRLNEMGCLTSEQYEILSQ